jgi:hypothetical protein
MNKFITLLSCISLLIQVQKSYSQEVKFGLQVGYGIYSLETLKNFQTDNLFYGSKDVVAFPNNTFYSSSIDFFLNTRNSIGINLMYLNTGARNHVADYSGEYKLDMLLNAYRIGGRYQNIILKNAEKNFQLQLGINFGVIFSKFRAIESIKIFEYIPDSQTFSYTRNSPFTEPFIGFSYFLGQGFYANCTLGYEFNVNYEIDLFESNDFYKWSLRTDWSGFRSSIGISYVL